MKRHPDVRTKLGVYSYEDHRQHPDDRAAIERLTQERDEAVAKTDKWVTKACRIDAQLQLQTARTETHEGEVRELRAELAKAREALAVALPHLEENALFLRDMQAHAGRTTSAFAAVEAVYAALAAKPEEPQP